MIIAALVRFLNLNSSRAFIALNPVWNVIAEESKSKYDFLAIYRLKHFWIFKAPASRLNCSKSFRDNTPNYNLKQRYIRTLIGKGDNEVSTVF